MIERSKLSPVQSEPLLIEENTVPLFIDAVSFQKVEMELNQPFETSFGRFSRLVKIFPVISFRKEDGAIIKGTGECPPLPAPWYDGECDGTVLVALTFILNSLTSTKEPVTDSASFIKRYAWIVGHNMAKVGVEGAYWDAVGKLHGKPVWELWKGKKRSVEAGISIGLEDTQEGVVKKVKVAVESLKAARVKIKIKPGKDIEYVDSIRKHYPRLRLQVDANASYDLFNPGHLGILKTLDQFELMMIEQPGKNDDIIDHARKLADLATPICLDESILHVTDARQAIELWAQYSSPSKLIINIKPPRVGGFVESLKIAQLCHKNSISTWCGGMLESALGKTANVHFSAREEVNLPGDHISIGPYFRRDVAESPVYRDGLIEVPQMPGWGAGEIRI